ncbi:hypothetical protein V6B05_01855 [Lactococcus garvieae]|uniref:hypothetical protein n=1 Tax=Lactococcus garvieae TaxID=1363 RepID=UPI001F6143C7|nr:hypothetical protein [Lactococcus garvieae]MCI3860170.1 hypothetical protein [Lactococcus garvieae]
MKKFELPEQPQKTNTSKDFTAAKEAIANLDKFDYAWKTYSHKLEKRFIAAIKYIGELERENQRLRAENLAVKTLMEDAKKQQPEIPEFVAEVVENHDLETLANWANLVPLLSTQVRSWLLSSDLVGHSYTYLLADLKINGYTVETPKVIVTPCPVCGYEDVESNFCSICGRKNDYE